MTLMIGDNTYEYGLPLNTVDGYSSMFINPLTMRLY